jgi:hypothetical protein
VFRPSAVWLVTRRLLHVNASSHLALRCDQGLVAKYKDAGIDNIKIQQDKTFLYANICYNSKVFIVT